MDVVLLNDSIVVVDDLIDDLTTNHRAVFGVSQLKPSFLGFLAILRCSTYQLIVTLKALQRGGKGLHPLVLQLSIRHCSI